MSAIFERISIRKYEKKSVSDEMIKKIIEAGCAAPSAGNQQPWQFYVVKNNEILEKLSHVHQWAGPVAEADFAIVPCYKSARPSYTAESSVIVGPYSCWVSCGKPCTRKQIR